MPAAYAADRVESTPAPVVSATPTPAKTTPTPVATPTPVPSVAAKNVNTELTKIRSLIEAKNFSAALSALKVADKAFPNNAEYQ